VTLVDADPSGAQLHSMLGVALDHVTSSRRTPRRPRAGDDPDTGLRLLPQRYSIGSTIRFVREESAVVRGLRLLDVDYVLLDLGRVPSPRARSLPRADLGIVATTPEPPSVEGVYRLARALFHRRFRRAIARTFQSRLLERALGDLPRSRPLDSCGPCPGTRPGSASLRPAS